MEPRVTITVNGQAVLRDEFNKIAEEASLTGDWLLAELLRPAPTGAGDAFHPVKYIIPSGGDDQGYINWRKKALVGSSAAADAKIHIQPFTAVMSSRSNPATMSDALRQIRTARHYGTTHPASYYSDLQIPAAINARWDLIYAKIDVETPDASVVRYVKEGDEALDTQSVQLITRTTVTIDRVGGVESGSPVQPALPSDSGNSYYIALAYVRVEAGHNLTTQISSLKIHEVFPPLPISSAFGVARSRPADGCYRSDGATMANEPWGSSRPNSYLSPGMQGKDEVLVPVLMADAYGTNVPPNVVTVLDRSVNWRKRLFRLHYDFLTPAAATDGVPWRAAPGNKLWSHTGTPNETFRVAESFDDDGTVSVATGGAVTNGYALLRLHDASAPFALASGAEFLLYVDTSGQLCAWRNNVDAARRGIIVVEAFARFHNADANGA